MSQKCGKCSADFEQNELSAKCTGCTFEFHPSCTSLGSQSFTKGKSKYWKCDNCVVKTTSQTKDSVSAAVDKNTLMEVLDTFKVDLKSHTDTVIGNVITKLDALNEQVNSLATKFNMLEDNHAALQERCNALEQENARMSEELQSLHARIDDAEQHSRCANIEVQGIPATPEENIYVVLEKLAAALGIKYNREDVSIAHRLRLHSKRHTHPPIICQFVSRFVKEQWIAAARSMKTLSSSSISPDVQSSTVYVNDHLTVNNKKLLGRARRLQRDQKIHFTGYFNGKILIKPRERDPAIRILCMADLDQFDR